VKKHIETNKAIKLYNSGYSTRKVAKELECSQTAVREWLKKAGIKSRKMGDYKHTEKQTLATRENLNKGIMAHIGRPLTKKHKQKISISEKGKPKRGKNYKGGRHLRPDGYVNLLYPEHPRARNYYVLEHIVIWERTYNKTLPEGYLIHHINGIRSDNRPENLMAVTKKQHHNLYQVYQKRIRELELEIARLKQFNLFPGMP